MEIFRDDWMRSMIKFSKSHIKIFFGTLIAMFVMVMLQLMGVKSPKLLWPVPQKPDTFYDVISPKLDSFENTYKVHSNTSIIPQADAAGEYDEAKAYAVIDYDNGDMLLSKDASTQLPIASLTKIMTAIVALDLAAPDEIFDVSPKASRIIPTKIAVEPGEQYTLHELLEAALMTSANDAVQVIREGIDTKYGQIYQSGKKDLFVRAMNEKAFLIGLKNTSFTNPQGFDDPNHYSSAEDLAILTQYALSNYPVIADIVKMDQTELGETDNHKRSVLYNWNGLIDVYPDTIGMKIGNTDAAGMTTVVVSNRGGKKLLAVVLGAPGILKRDLWASQLLDLGYKNTLGLASIEVTEKQLREKYATWIPWN
jgi:serine-type D-Ala-D-Ala carboxypeptidase (penicillin-binding protein 5/6)